MSQIPMVGLDEAPSFEVDLRGPGSRVRMNGVELQYVRDVKVYQPLGMPPTIIIEFVAREIVGIKESAS